MGRWEACLGSKIYTFRKQYPVFGEFEKRIREVERELNKESPKKKEPCNNCRKSSCGNGCKNRQKW